MRVPDGRPTSPNCECIDPAVTPTRNNKCIAPENGAIGSPHGRLKNASAMPCCSATRDFDDLDAYHGFIDEDRQQRNARHCKPSMPRTRCRSRYRVRAPATLKRLSRVYRSAASHW
ncbi:hypothetical protein J2Z31_002637 [Sinorhizobium kostiense]|uniref:Uncharacterized protein n=1 Tax=Sinorhizobium kostiense TaxID=76747 RepID=A0ABS4QZS0_9HYPH|nr:hypothetical protein [Sinorhizobium kostiense]MBP2236123.1 hypothetical protein [Sinorhizobium kostiense]